MLLNRLLEPSSAKTASIPGRKCCILSLRLSFL